jgi:hypothetical protein
MPLSPATPTLLAQTERSTGSIVFWSIVLILAMVAMFFGLALYRRWMTADDTPTTGPAFTLSDLRKLHKEGKMTTEEYEKAKTAIVGSLKASTEKPKAPEGPRKQPPFSRDPEGSA